MTWATTLPSVADLMPRSRYSKNERSPRAYFASLACDATKPRVVMARLLLVVLLLQARVEAQGLEAKRDLLLQLDQLKLELPALGGNARGRQQRPQPGALVKPFDLRRRRARVLEDLHGHAQRLGRRVPAGILGKRLAVALGTGELARIRRFLQASGDLLVERAHAIASIA